MKNFDLFKEDVIKCDSIKEFSECLELWRFGKFPCEPSETCLQSTITCEYCYRNWLDSEVE